MRNHYKFCSICGGKLKLGTAHPFCRKCGFVNYRNPRPTVTALILNKDKILLTKRRREPFKSWWDLPGGFIDYNEIPEEALRRESKEELGFNPVKLNFFGIYRGTYPSSFDPFHILNVVYIVRLKDAGEIKVKDKEELSAIRWFTKKELPRKIAFDSNRQIMKDFLKIWN